MFLVADTVHNYLEQLVFELRKLGCVLNTKYVLHNMEYEHKDSVLQLIVRSLWLFLGL